MELPSHLETLRGLVAPQEAASRPEANAARELLDRLNSEEAAIETTELASLWREYDGLTWDDDFVELSDQQRVRARELAHAIDWFHRRLRVAREATYSAVALSHLVRGSSREEMLRDLESCRWAEKHEVLTRWHWCCEQKRQIAEGRSVNYPFLCNWGPREGRKNLDREFYPLLRFLPRLHRASGRKLLIEAFHGNRSNHRPDFDLCEPGVGLVGIEITEVLLNREAAHEQKCCERVVGAIERGLIGEGVLIEFLQRPSWKNLAEHSDALVAWVCDGLHGRTQTTSWLGRPCHRTDHFSGEGGRALVLHLKPTSQGAGVQVLDMSRVDGSAGPYAGSKVDRQVAEALVGRIQEKLQGPPPCIKPCLLLLYENTQLPVLQFDGIRTEVRLSLGSLPDSHFTEIWLMDDSKAVRLA